MATNGRVDYTRMRVGRVVSRWGWTDRDGNSRIGEKKIIKCPVCGKGSVREIVLGTFDFLHGFEVDSTTGMAFRRNHAKCTVKATDADKAEFGAYYCATAGCWREAAKDTEGMCSKHQVGLSGPGILKALDDLLATHRLGEPKFADKVDALRAKLNEINEGKRER